MKDPSRSTLIIDRHFYYLNDCQLIATHIGMTFLLIKGNTAQSSLTRNIFLNSLQKKMKIIKLCPEGSTNEMFQIFCLD